MSYTEQLSMSLLHGYRKLLSLRAFNTENAENTRKRQKHRRGMDNVPRHRCPPSMNTCAPSKKNWIFWVHLPMEML